MKKYTLTAEHRAQLAPWAEKWKAIALSTAPMGPEDREAMVAAINGQYRAAKMEPPRNIIFVSSPCILRFAGGFAAAMWHLKSGGKPEGKMSEKKQVIPYECAIVEAAMAAASDKGRVEVIHPSKHKSTDFSRWYVAHEDPTKAAHALGLGEFGMKVAAQAYDMWRGNNQWAAWAAYLSFFRHVVKLPLDYSKWEHYESACIHGGPMIMHSEFCMVSDRPETLSIDAANRPHNVEGPFCKWRDGSALYSVNGTRIPAWILEQPEKITVKIIENESNASIRRVMTDKYGAAKYMVDSGAKVIHQDDFGTLYRKEVPGDEPIVMCKVIDASVDETGTIPEYWIGVPPEMKRAKQAIAWTFDKSESEYSPDEQT